MLITLEALETLEKELEQGCDGQCRDKLSKAYETIRSLHNELAAVQKKLRDRKKIERAKGVLMRKFRWTEAESFRRLQRAAMNWRRSMIEVAEDVLSGKELDWTF